jgi:SAM-dependent methyltransferase
MGAGESVVKKDFGFGWTEWTVEHESSRLALEHQKGDVLDVGCSNCQLLKYLRSKGWKGKYSGVDLERAPGYDYPADAELLFGDALEVRFPEADTVILYNILEHVDDPVGLLRKSLAASRGNVLVDVPKRNEGLWELGVIEFHQLDKSHKHCGFSKEEVYALAERAGGRVASYAEVGEVNATVGRNLWNSRFPRAMMTVMDVLFSSKRFNQGIWCEIVRR